jgi:hypothetical protein
MDSPLLLSFDMSNDVFQEALGPLTKGSFSEEVAVINDSVALILRFSHEWEDWSEIWVLNEYESGVERTWTKKSTIPHCEPNLYDQVLIQLREDGCFVLSDDDGRFVLSDPRTQELRHLSIYEAILSQIVSYTESLVFLNGLRNVIEKQDNS